MDGVTLADVLAFLGAAGAGAVAYWLMEQVAFLTQLPPREKRLAAFLLTAAVAVAAYLAQVGMLYQAAPPDWRGWVEALTAVAFGAIGLGQLIHGQRKL